ncbi:MAG: hypothetical protein FWD49_06695 [Firmicutes bacterium]|nr:hypothetical protein [Bacillota bacterium]
MATMAKFKREAIPKRKRHTLNVNVFKGIDALNEEGLMGFNRCRYASNIRFVNGAIANGFGIELAKVPLGLPFNGNLNNVNVLQVPTTVQKVFNYKRTANGMIDDRLVVLDSNYRINQLKLTNGGTSVINTMAMWATDFANYNLNGDDVLICTSLNAGMYVINGDTSTQISNSPSMTSICIHYERLFGTNNQFSVYFSELMNPAGWEISPEGAGEIKIKDEGGRITKILPFRNNLYIFKEHAIYRMTCFGSPSDFKIEKVLATDQVIRGETVCDGGDKIIFMADSDIFLFDGFSARRAFGEITAFIKNNTRLKAFYCKNKYHICTEIYTDGMVLNNIRDENSGIITIDFVSGETAFFRGGRIRNMIPLSYGNYYATLVVLDSSAGYAVYMLNETGEMMTGFSPKKSWRSANVNFGKPDELKVIKRIYLSSLYPLTMKVATNLEEKEFTVLGSNKPVCIPVNLIGDTVRVELSTEAVPMFVTGIMLELDTGRRYYAN